MSMRLGPGPVFAYEWVTASRRWQPYAMRAGFVALLLIGMAMAHAALGRGGPDRRLSLRETARFGESLYRNIAWIELTLVLLAAPAATAGAVCLDKARGTLDHMLVTELSNGEIVLGKLGVRLIPVLGLIAGTFPILALASLLGGIDPRGLVGLFLVAVGCAVLGCSLAMALSVYGRKTHEVAIMSYMLIILWVMAVPILSIVQSVLMVGFGPAIRAGRWASLREWVEWSNPYFLALAPYDAPAPVGAMTYPGFLAGCLALSAALIVAATAGVRGVGLRRAGRPESNGRRRLSRAPSRRWLPGPSMDRNPVAWREWHRARPSLMMRIAWGLYAALGLSWVGLAARASRGITPYDVKMICIMNMIQVSIGLVLLSAAAATSLAEERVRGSLDVLLSTPMPTPSILAGKWWGSYRRVLGVAIWPAATAAFLASDRGYWSGYVLLIALVLAYGAVITGLGLAIATWVRRLGLAIALCVVIPILLAIGWPILLRFLPGLPRSAGPILQVGDPPVGVMYATASAARVGFSVIGPGVNREDFLIWGSGWIVALALVALSLFAATMATFDGCLGRIPDEGLRPPRPGGRSSLSADELLALVPTSAEDEP